MGRPVGNKCCKHHVLFGGTLKLLQYLQYSCLTSIAALFWTRQKLLYMAIYEVLNKIRSGYVKARAPRVSPTLPPRTMTLNVLQLPITSSALHRPNKHIKPSTTSIYPDRADKQAASLSDHRLRLRLRSSRCRSLSWGWGISAAELRFIARRELGCGELARREKIQSLIFLLEAV